MFYNFTIAKKTYSVKADNFDSAFDLLTELCPHKVMTIDNITTSTHNAKRIEFYYYMDQKTDSRKLDIIDETNMILATLDKADFHRIHMNNRTIEGINTDMQKEIIKYCNEYKATNIKNFVACVF